MPKWLQILEMLGPVAIAVTVPGGQAIAPLIVTAIKSAEQLKGATGPEKKAHALEIVSAGAQVAQGLGAKIDPVLTTQTAANVIDGTVGIVNIVQGMSAPEAAPAN